MEAGDRLQIDDQHYEVVGPVSFTEGSGDDSTTWLFYGLRRESDGQKLYVEEEGDKATLYQILDDKVSAPELADVDLERGLTSVDDAAFSQFVPEGKLVWGRTRAKLGAAPPPFTGTRSLLLYRGSNEQYPLAVFYARTLVKEDENVYCSAIWPAAKIERRSMTPAEVPTALLPINYAIALAVGCVALAPLALPEQSETIVTAFWFVGFGTWIARAFGRTTPFYVGAHIVSNAWLIWFCTKLVDNYWIENQTPTAHLFVPGRLGVLILALVVIRMVSRRVYFMIADGAKWGGTISMSCYGVGLLIASMIEEYWYGRHFAWYAGAWPGWVWLPVLVIAVIYKVDDYRHVPLRWMDFTKQLERLRSAFRAGPGQVQEANADLHRVADDLGDAVNISDDPQIAALHNYNDTFFKIAEVIGALAKADPEDVDLELMTEDLEVLAEDLSDLVAPGKSGLQTLRISPQGRCLI